MPPGAKYVGRPGLYGNPFYVGGMFMRGDPRPDSAGVFRMVYCEALVPDPRATKLETIEQCLEWYRWLRTTAAPHSERDLAAIRGRDLACWCRLCPAHADGKPLGVECPDCAPCHADLLLATANGPA